MKVFVDTNVILEYVLQRERYVEAKRAIARGAELKGKLFMSVGGFYTMLFVVEKYFRKDLQQSRLDAVTQTRDVMRKVLSLFSVAGHNKSSFLRGISDVEYKDIEDSCQYQAAQRAGCEVLITFNDVDYPVAEGAIPCVMTPQEFLANRPK